MAMYDQIKKLFQDVVAPEIRALQGKIKAIQVEIRRLDDKIDTGLKSLGDKIEGVRREMHARMDGLDAKFVGQPQRIDGRIDALDRELKVAIEVRERIAILESKLAPR